MAFQSHRAAALLGVALRRGGPIAVDLAAGRSVCGGGHGGHPAQGTGARTHGEAAGRGGGDHSGARIAGGRRTGCGNARPGRSSVSWRLPPRYTVDVMRLRWALKRRGRRNVRRPRSGQPLLRPTPAALHVPRGHSYYFLRRSNCPDHSSAAAAAPRAVLFAAPWFANAKRKRRRRSRGASTAIESSM